MRRWPERSFPAAPAEPPAALHVTALDACDGLVPDQGDAGVRVAAGLLAAARIFHAGVDAEGTHLHRVLLRGRGDHAVADIAHAFAPAVDRDDDHALF